jgi:riboflavin biosynthesis pyrimidine reductase
MSAKKRPYVVLQMAASIDGRIAFAPDLTMFDQHPAARLLPDGAPVWNKVAAAIEADWHPTGTMMGSGTVLRRDARLKDLPPVERDGTLLYQDFLPAEVVEPTRTWAILVDGRGRCRSGYKATETPGNHILHLTSRAAPAEYLAFLRRERIPYLVDGEAHVDVRTALPKLSAVLGLRVIRLWGGGTLNGVMFRHRLVDEVHQIVQPVVIGGAATPTLVDCADLQPGEDPAVLRLLNARTEDAGYVWLHYRVENAG